MREISEGLIFLLFLFLSFRDIQTRKVSVLLLVITGILSVLFQMMHRQMNLWVILGGAVLGGVFVLISKMTDEGIGYGDSYGIMVLGVFLGIWRMMTVLFVAFFLLICVLVPLLWHKRMSRNVSLPFYPFLTGGYLCLLLMEGWNW